VYRETTRHFESKECVVKACVLTTEYIIRHLVYFSNLFGLGKHPTKRIGTSLNNFVKNNFNPLGTVEAQICTFLCNAAPVCPSGKSNT
jgi:hypothetical protein